MPANDAPWIATGPITLNGGALGYSPGMEVSAQVVRDNPVDTEGLVTRPGTKAAEKAVAEPGGGGG